MTPLTICGRSAPHAQSRPASGGPQPAPAELGRAVAGRPHPTIESLRQVRGRGEFVGDFDPPGMLHVAMVRSPHAHAKIDSVDASAALAAPGVQAVLTGRDVAERSGPIFTLAALADPPLPIAAHALPADKARYAGEAVVAVAAISRATAEDAAELVEVAYTPLDSVLTPQTALADGAPRLYEHVEGNSPIRRSYRFGDVDGVFARASRIVRRRISWSRQTGSALDTFGCVAHWDPDGQGVTFHSNLQSYALLPSLAATLGLAADKVRGVPRDIGGSFGAKFWQPHALVVCALLARQTGRPVRFVEDRVEHLESGNNHGEDRVYDAELALDDEGHMLGLRYSMVEDYGSAMVLGTVGASEPLATAVGPYRMEATGIDFTAVLTNKTGQAAYRGFGTAALSFLLERMTDAAARETGLSRVEIRERNLIEPDAFPYRTPTGNMYDSGDYPEALRQALELSDFDGWMRRRERARSEGRALGIGVATCQERSVQGGGALWLMYDQTPGARPSTAAETVTCRIDPQGNVRIALHTPSLGTATETVAAVVAAEELGIAMDHISVSRLDTHLAGPGIGPSASRMTVMLAGAVAGAVRELREAMRIFAADVLDVAPDRLAWDHSRCGYAVSDDPERLATLTVLAARANTQGRLLPDGVRSGLEATYTYDHPFASWPSEDGSDWGSFAPIVGHAVHIPVVEVDVETGEVEFLSYTVVHDCGTVLNPAAVRGQLIGGIAQGIACALNEQLSYSADGSLIERDLRSFFMPTSIDVPKIDIHHVTSPSPFTWRGVKGVGEGGRIVAPAAVISAVEHALEPWGVQIDEVPATPEKIVAWLAG